MTIQESAKTVFYDNFDIWTGNPSLGERDRFNDMYHSLMPKLFDTDNSAVEDKRGNPRILYQDRNI